MKDIHNNYLFTGITAEEEVSVQGGGWDTICQDPNKKQSFPGQSTAQNFLIGKGLSLINPGFGLAWSLYNTTKSLYDYNKCTAPYRDSNGRLIAS